MNVEHIHLLAGKTLTATATDTSYTGPAGYMVVIRQATVTNTTAGVVALTVYRIPSGDALGTANTLISARNVAVGGTDLCPELVGKVIRAGDLLQAKGAGLSIDVDGTSFVI